MSEHAPGGIGDRVASFWRDRNPRERTMLATAVAVIVLALVYAVALAPALDGRAQLQRSLPSLRLQAAEFQSLSRQAAQIAQAEQAAPVPLSQESVESSLVRRGLKAQNVALTGELVRVQLTGASFTAMLEWLDEIRRSARASVIDASIVGQSTPDSVNATLTLRQQKSGGSGE